MTTNNLDQNDLLIHRYVTSSGSETEAGSNLRLKRTISGFSGGVSGRFLTCTDTSTDVAWIDKNGTLTIDGSVPAFNLDEQASAPGSPVSGDIYLDDGTNTASGSPGWRRYTGAAWEDVGALGGGSGDVLGPATSTDHTIARFNGTDNKTIQGSLVSIDDSGSVNIPSGQTYKINGTDLTYTDVGAEQSGAVSTHAALTTTHGVSGNLVGTTDTQTLSAKTLTSPVINVGSDADGDMYYRASGAFSRLAKGTAYQVLRMNSDATAPEWTTNTHSATWVIDSPAVGGVPGPRIPKNWTVTRIDAYVTAATSATFNIEERSTIGSAGTNIMTSDLAATTTGASDTGAFNDSALAAGNWLWVDISAVSGTPGKLVLTLTYTVA